MSNVSNIHSIDAYTSGVTKPFSGQRLSTVGYKTDKNTGVKKDSVCVSVPMIAAFDLVNRTADFIPHLISLCERAQDGIVRNAHESGRTQVSDVEISVDAIIEFLNAESSGGRLSKVAVIEWFDSEIADSLAVAIAAKMGLSSDPSAAESDRIEKLLAEFRNNIGALTAGNTKYDADTCRVLQKALSFAPADDPIAVRFIARLDTMSKVVPKSMVDSL